MNGSHILDHFRLELAKALCEQSEPPPEYPPLNISPWLAMSLMQKAIRRGRPEFALRADDTIGVSGKRPKGQFHQPAPPIGPSSHGIRSMVPCNRLEQDGFKSNQAAKTQLPCPLPPEGRRGTRLHDLRILLLRPWGRRGPG